MNGAGVKVKKESGIDLTQGKIFGKLLAFILPIMAANLLQAFYNAADMIVVSLSGEGDAVGAIGTTGTLITLVFSICVSVSIGAKVVIARALGEGNAEAVRRAVRTAVVTGFLFGILCSGVGLIVAKPALQLLGNKGKLLDLSVLYTRIYMLGVPFVSLTNFFTAILHGEGNSKTPFVVLVISGLINVALNLFFVLVCKMTVDGVALATVISNGVSAVVLLVVLMRENTLCKVVLRELRIYKDSFVKMLEIGIPAALQTTAFTVSNMLIQSSIIKVNDMLVGPDVEYQPVVKGNSVSTSIESFLYTAAASIGQASVSFVGQNAGAKKYDRIKRGMIILYAVSFIVPSLFAGAVILLRDPILALYGIPHVESGLEKIAYDAALSRMLLMFIPYFTLGFMELGSGMMQGFGRALTAAVCTLTGACVFRIIWIFTVFAADPTLDAIYISYPISWALTSAAHFVMATITLKKLKKRAAADEELQRQSA